MTATTTARRTRGVHIAAIVTAAGGRITIGVLCCVTCSPTGGNAGGDVTPGRRRPEVAAADDAEEAEVLAALLLTPRFESSDWLRTLPLMARLKLSNSPPPLEALLLSGRADWGGGGCEAKLRFFSSSS